MQVQHSGASTVDPSALKNSKNAKAEKSVASPSPNKISDPSGNESSVDGVSSTDNKASAYLKVVSRLENMIKKDEISEAVVKNFSKAIETRLSELDPKDSQKIMNLPETKALNVTSTEQLIDTVKDGLLDKEKSRAVLDFLKRPEFSELMSGKPKQETYAPEKGPVVSGVGAPQVDSEGGPEVETDSGARNIDESQKKTIDSPRRSERPSVDASSELPRRGTEGMNKPETSTYSSPIANNGNNAGHTIPMNTSIHV